MFVLSRFFLLYAILFCNISRLPHNIILDLAEKYFNSENYYDAITEYKRYIFFNSKKEDEKITYAYYKIGLAYRNQGKWKDALKALQKSIETANTEYIRDERKIDLSIVLIASGNYSYAEFHLIKVEMFSHIPKIKQRAAFFRGISALYSFKWKRAREAFHVYFNNQKIESKKISKKIDSLLSKAQNFKYKSPKLAKILSTILPGAGQIYAADWRNGINALVINVATGYFFINDLLKRQYLNAIFKQLFLFRSFYRGNRSLAEESAKNYNHNINKKFVKKILGIIKEK